MTDVSLAPGVVKKATKVFVVQADVAEILGCCKSKAYNIVREVNEYAKKNGNLPFPSGRASKYLFAELYGIPIDEVNRVISNRTEA